MSGFLSRSLTLVTVLAFLGCASESGTSQSSSVSATTSLAAETTDPTSATPATIAIATTALPTTITAAPTTTGVKRPAAQELAALAARSVVAPADLGAAWAVTLPGAAIVAPKEAKCVDRAAPELARVGGVGGEIGRSIAHSASGTTLTTVAHSFDDEASLQAWLEMMKHPEFEGCQRQDFEVAFQNPQGDLTLRFSDRPKDLTNETGPHHQTKQDFIDGRSQTVGFLDIRYYKIRNVLVAFQLVHIGTLSTEQGAAISTDMGTAYVAVQGRIRAW